jgi:cryptochrome 1
VWVCARRVACGVRRARRHPPLARALTTTNETLKQQKNHKVKEELGALGVRVASFNADLLYEPWQVLDDDNEPFTTFKDFWDRCLSMPYAPPLPLPPPASLPPVPDAVVGVPVAAVDWFASPEQEAATQALAHRWDPRPEAARARLDKFLATALPTFEHDRAKVGFFRCWGFFVVVWRVGFF